MYKDMCDDAVKSADVKNATLKIPKTKKIFERSISFWGQYLTYKLNAPKDNK